MLYNYARTFYQVEISEMLIDETPTYQHVQQLQIIGWTFTKEKQL
jgi:hypothetical protein